MGQVSEDSKSHDADEETAAGCSTVAGHFGERRPVSAHELLGSQPLQGAATFTYRA